MKKLLFILGIVFFTATGVAAKDLVINVCKGDNCYIYHIADVKDFKYIHDMNGRKYMRLYLFNNRILDINVDGAEVKVKVNK